jgi:hypothetical protein
VLVELFAAVATAKAAVVLRGPFDPFALVVLWRLRYKLVP